VKRILLFLILVGLLTVISMLFAGCGAGDSQLSSPSLIFSLSGSGDEIVGVGQKTSELFHITQREWYIESTCEPLDQAGPITLLATIYPESESVNSMNFLDVIQMSSNGPDRNYFHEKGNLY